MERLINKLNNIEKNGIWVERHYWLGGRLWFIGNKYLLVDGKRATDLEIEEFLKLKKECDGK